MKLYILYVYRLAQNNYSEKNLQKVLQFNQEHLSIINFKFDNLLKI